MEIIKKVIFIALTFLIISGSIYSQEEKNDTKFNPSTLIPDVNGLMQVWGKYGVQNLDESAFVLRRMEIKFSGDILPGKISYVAMIDPVSKTKFVDETGNSKYVISVLQDMFITMKFSDAAKLTVGQFLYPLTREGLTPSGDLLFAERSIIGRVVGDKRDIGVQLSGDLSFLNYAVALINGNGPDHSADNNQSKDISARVVFKPINGLEIGGYGYTGTNTLNGVDFDKKRYGGEFEYSIKNLGVIAEYAKMEDWGVKSGGYYASAYYNILSNLYGAVRYEGWDPNESIDNNDITVLSIGGGYYMYEQHLKVHLDYTATSQKDKDSIGEIIAGIQVTF